MRFTTRDRQDYKTNTAISLILYVTCNSKRKLCFT